MSHFSTDITISGSCSSSLVALNEEGTDVAFTFHCHGVANEGSDVDVSLVVDFVGDVFPEEILERFPKLLVATCDGPQFGKQGGVHLFDL